MEVMMKTFNKWASCLAVIFVLAIIFVVANPVSAAQASDNKNPGGAAGALTQAQQQSQNTFEQGVGDPQGPPENPGPGCYKKIHGKKAETTYKYFPNGHPEGQSEWEYVGPTCPYGQ
jgi:hypothetical protein